MHYERENLLRPKHLKLGTHFSHEAWIERHLNSKDTLFCLHDQDIQAKLTNKHLKLKFEVVLGRGLQGEPIFAHNATKFRGKEASLGCISLCLQERLYSKTLFGQPSEH